MLCAACEMQEPNQASLKRCAEVVSATENLLFVRRSLRKVGKGKKCSCLSTGEQWMQTKKPKPFPCKARPNLHFPQASGTLPAHWHIDMFKLV